ncbi:3D domain-containing protein [Lutibacter holmesii]|uniref:3D domain-containing protein n=1 Tax=Lutibacter holmesii TaxID=1137985 RepID=A0ABW3WSM6_9FLAO
MELINTQNQKVFPIFNSILNEGVKNTPSDPQNFNLLIFNTSLNKAYSELTHNINANTNNSNSLNLWATYYYLPILNHDAKGIDLLDSKGNKTNLKLSLCDWCNANIQGTVMVLKDNQKHLLNYSGRSNDLQNDCRECERYKNYDGYLKTGKVLWKKSVGFGFGVKNYKLVPFKTIAVDNSVIPFGSVIFIPEAKGVEYILDGQVFHHDGYFFAGDTGSKITGNHIDVFIGINKSNPFKFIKSNSSNTFKAEIITDQIKIEQLKELHK